MSASVHVLHVVRTFGPTGGMERNLRRVAVELTARGQRHTIALLNADPEVLSLPPEVPLVRVPAAPKDRRLPWRLRALLQELRPTVIHARNWGAWPDVALARLLLPGASPLIFSYHGMEGTTVSRSLALRFQLIARLTTRVFAVSHAARALLIEGYGLPATRVEVLLNGVDSARFAPRPRPTGGRVVIGAVGRLFAVKNLAALLRAVAELLARGLDVELVLAGTGPDEGMLRELGRSLGLGDRLRMLGHVDDVPGALAELDLFALPSLNEANPNSLLEAMSAGKACVATDVGGSAELLAGGQAGLLVPPGDERALAQALAGLVLDPERRRALAAAARERVLAHYTQEEMFRRYQALYADPRRG